MFLGFILAFRFNLDALWPFILLKIGFFGEFFSSFFTHFRSVGLFVRKLLLYFFTLELDFRFLGFLIFLLANHYICPRKNLSYLKKVAFVNAHFAFTNCYFR